jgi:hypothetical protein
MSRIPVAIAVLAITGAAHAGLQQGTPMFTCTPPTQQIDNLGNLSPIPATGPQALTAFRFYLDGNTTPIKNTAFNTSAPNQGCQWQTNAGEIAAGTHNITVTAVNIALQESVKSNVLNFTVPSAVVQGPNAPSNFQVQ